MDYKAFVHAINDMGNFFSWEVYQCAVFLFSNSGNVIHAFSTLFSLMTAVFLRKLDKKQKIPQYILCIGELGCAILTPWIALFWTHLLPGFVCYIWIAFPLLAAASWLFIRVKQILNNTKNKKQKQKTV